MLDTHAACISDDGVQEQEIPGAYYYVEIPDDQE